MSDTTMTKTDREVAIETMRGWLDQNPVYLDTETTGLKRDAEICDIAVVDYDGVTIFESLVKPSLPIPPAASGVHGITDEMVEDAPKFVDLSARLHALLKDRLVIIYNREFDTRLIAQSGASHLAELIRDVSVCAMLEFATINGEWNSHYGNYKWVTLSNAASWCALSIPPDLHRARADADLTRRVVDFVGRRL